MTRVISVIGLGLIGGSLGAALRASGARVAGFDVSSRHREIALDRGLVDEVVEDLDDVMGADAVLLATPLGVTLDLLPLIANGTRPDTLILDVASVKTLVVQTMERIRHPERALGGHPLAGSEKSGPRFAVADLFAGRPFILTPTPHTAEETIRRAQDLLLSIRLQGVVMDAAQHDETLARTSHVPQLVSTTLALGLQPYDDLFSGPGLRDMTRLARSEVGMWEEIIAANRSNIGVQLRAVIGRLDGMAQALERDDQDTISHLLQSGRARAEALAP